MIDFAYSVVAWTMVAIFLVATVFWLVEVLIVGRARDHPQEYGLDEIQVRVMTIDAEPIVQGTVDSLPERLTDVHVIAERPIEVDDATVHVVPESFSCTAKRKGRAAEWARRNVPTPESEFVLYLDEDTLVPELPPFPDADIVQLMERPVRTDSWLCYFAEIFRMGFQIEQRTFPRFRFPLYAWGGGFAVRASLEDEIGWDVDTVTEDTNFIWRAFASDDRKMAVLPVKLLNQAPPTIMEMIHQRRRWISGAARDSNLLPIRYRLLSLFRNAAWALVALSPVLLLPYVSPLSMTLWPAGYQYVILFQLVGLFSWGFIGYWYYAERFRVLVALFVTLPVVALLHAVGALWAVISPTTTFRVTQKVPPTEIHDEVVEELHLEEHHHDHAPRPHENADQAADTDGEGREESAGDPDASANASRD
ncbi:hypothetical protein JCM17823_15370 [Halorubrum gandharaense]